MMRGRAGKLSAAVLGVIVLAAVLGPWAGLPDPERPDVARRLQPPEWTRGDDGWRPLGTDELGRDVLSRVVHGARTSLAVSGLAVVLGAGLGSALGLAAGWRGGWVDAVFSRLADVQQALPFIVLVLAAAAVAGPSFVAVVLVLGLGSWVVHFRIVRGATLAAARQPFVEAARALGATDGAIVRRHVAPHVLPVIVVNVTTFVPQLMLFEAALGFLGLGVPPPTPTWGGMIAAGRGYVEVAWWMSVFPGLALTATVAALHGLGQELTARLDPRRSVSTGPRGRPGKKTRIGPGS